VVLRVAMRQGANWFGNGQNMVRASVAENKRRPAVFERKEASGLRFDRRRDPDRGQKSAGTSITSGGDQVPRPLRLRSHCKMSSIRSQGSIGPEGKGQENLSVAAS